MIKGLRAKCILLLLSVAVTLGFALLNAPAYAQFEDEPNEYILSVMLPPNWLISEAIFAYEKDDKYYLPITELGQGLEFYVEKDPTTNYVSGFASTEDQTFIIDAERGELIVNDIKEELPQNSILEHEIIVTDDLYVQLEVLQRIWPIELQMDLANLALIVDSEEELAFVRKRERERRLEMFQIKKELRSNTRSLPYQETPYQWFGKPVIDIQSTANYDTDNKKFRADNNISGKQHLGKMIAEYNVNMAYIDSKVQRPDSIRFKLQRRSPGSEYIVPGVRSFELGDVALPQRELVANSVTGRGVIVSNDNRDRGFEFDRITLRDTGPPGWDIEIYNNDELIDFGVVPDNGEYVFDDIILNYGNNEVKTIFFGPQGQIREKIESYNAAGSLLKPKEFRYLVGALDSDRSFILLNNAPRNDPRGVAKVTELGYGFTRWLTGFMNYSEMPTQNGPKKYASIGAAISTAIGSMETEFYNEINGGNAYDIRVLTGLHGFRFNLRASVFNDNYESEDAGFDTGAKSSELAAQINKNTRILGIPLGLRLNAIQTALENGTTTTTFDFSQSVTNGGLRLSNTNTTRLVNEQHQRTTGAIAATWREGDWQLRGGFNYDVYPQNDLTSFNSQLRYRPDDQKYFAALSAKHSFTSSVSGAGAQIGYDFDKVLTSFQADYEQERGWDFTLRATTSIHPYTEDGNYDFSSKSMRNTAPIRARAFLDKEQDGIFDPEEDTPLENVALKIQRSRTKDLTNENGFITTTTAPNRVVNISLDEGTLEDPYFVAGAPGISTIPLRGTIVDTMFPVFETGSIEGTAYQSDNLRAVTGMTLELLNEKNEVISTSDTAFDGYYSFEFIPAGTYTIRPLAKYGVVVEGDKKTVILTPEELFVYEHNIFVTVATKAQMAAAEAKEQQQNTDIEAPNNVAVTPATAPESQGQGRGGLYSIIDKG